MPYTNAWAVTNNPAGTDPSSNTDDDIRKLRLDLYERMLTLGIDLSDDPIELTTVRYHYLHWSEFNPLGAAIIANTNGLATNSSGTYRAYAPLILPRGSNVSEIATQIVTGASDTSIKVMLKKVDDAATVTTLATITVGANQALATHVAPLDETLDDAGAYEYYYLEVEFIVAAGQTGRLYGVRVEYTPTKLW